MSVEKMVEAAQESNFMDFAAAFTDHIKSINLEEAKAYKKDIEEEAKKKAKESEESDDDNEDE